MHGQSGRSRAAGITQGKPPLHARLIAHGQLHTADCTRQLACLLRPLASGLHQEQTRRNGVGQKRRKKGTGTEQERRRARTRQLQNPASPRQTPQAAANIPHTQAACPTLVRHLTAACSPRMAALAASVAHWPKLQSQRQPRRQKPGLLPQALRWQTHPPD